MMQQGDVYKQDTCDYSEIENSPVPTQYWLSGCLV